MANNFNTNPIQIDTAGAGSTTPKIISGIVVIASGDNWSCVLHNASGGSVIFRADSNIANHRSVYFGPAKSFNVSGIYATTLTNIALVLVYTA